MKILIISDTHRRNELFLRVLEQEAPVDMILHAGDAEGSEDEFSRIAGMPLFYVAGNCDIGSMAPRTMVVPIGNKKAFLTHGHYYQVGFSLDELERETRTRHCQIAVFGHTHIPLIQKSRHGVLILNPGSLGRPRQSGFRPSYMILHTDKDGNVEDPILKYL